MKNKLKKVISLILAFAMVVCAGTASLGTVSAAAKTTVYKNYIKYRGQNLKNTYAKLNAGEEITVAYYGGSVTNGTGVDNPDENSWRGLIGNWLIDNFPQATVNNVNIAYGGTGSKFGAYRLKNDVISLAPDLIFVEFAINDHYDDQVESVDISEYGVRYETIIRNIRKELPECDIVTILTTEKGYVSKNQAGELHAHAQEHENICIAYDVPSIHVGRALSDKITPGQVAEGWAEYSGDIVHLNQKGNKVYYDVIAEYFNNCLFHGGYDGTVKNHTLPTQVNDYLIDGDLTYIPITQELYSKSVELCGVNNYSVDKTPSTSKYWKTFNKSVLEPKTTNQKADLSFAFEFTGTAVTMLEHSDNVSSFKITVDDSIVRTVEFDKISPREIISGLEYGKHKIVIRPIYTSGVMGYIYIQGFFIRNEENCSAKYDHEHVFNNYVSDKNATCRKNGTKTAKCYKKGCDVVDTVTDYGSKLSHKYVINVNKKATTSKNGSAFKECEYCGRFEETVVIKKIKTLKLSTKEYTYNGKYKTPKVVVKDSKGKTISSKYYTISGTKKAKNVGKYKIKITFKGRYKGTKYLYYTIKPAKTKVTKVTASKKKLTVKYSKKKTQISGYQIQYSTSKKFTAKYTKTKTVKSYKTTSVTLKSLKAKKTYYVRVRTYKTVNGKRYYSDWSSRKTKKTK